MCRVGAGVERGGDGGGVCVCLPAFAVFFTNAPAQIPPALAGDGGSQSGLPAAKV